MARTDSPAPESSRAVPPVETISTPSSASPRANSTSPRLSDTVSSARRTRTSPGWVTSTGPWSVVAIAASLDDHRTRRIGVDPHLAGRDQSDGTRQQPVLDLVHSFLDRGDVTRIRKNVEGFLQDDRPGVDALVDVVDGDPHDLDAVVESLLDRAYPPECRQQRRVDVDDPPAEAPDELRAEDLHEPGEHHQVRSERLDPIPHSRVPRRAVLVVRRGKDRGIDACGAPALEPARLGSVRSPPTTSASRPCTESRIAWRFEPSPETSTATRRLTREPRVARARGTARSWSRSASLRSARRCARGCRRGACSTRRHRPAGRHTSCARSSWSARHAGSPRM